MLRIHHRIGKNTEGDDLLVDICNCLFSLLKQLYSFFLSFLIIYSTSYILDPNQSYFTAFLSTLVALNVTDAISLETGSGNKYNTNRPKGKLNSMQVFSFNIPNSCNRNKKLLFLHLCMNK